MSQGALNPIEAQEKYREILALFCPPTETPSDAQTVRARRVFQENFGFEPPRIDPRPLEKVIQADAVKGLRESGYVVIVHDAGNKTGGKGRPGHRAKAAAGRPPPGYPDVEVKASNGVSVLLEFKRPGEKPTDDQRAMHARLESLGHRVYVVTSRCEAFDAVLAESIRVRHFWASWEPPT